MVINLFKVLQHLMKGWVINMYRTWMFIPGSKDKHLTKAGKLPADTLIFDLEDAVSLADKESARLKVKQYIENLKDRLNYVRVNALTTPYFLEDINEIITPNLTGIVLPKSNKKEDMIIVDYILGQLEQKHGLPEGSLSIVPLIETAQGLNNVDEIVSASKRIHCLAFGAEDLTLDLNIETGAVEQELLYARSKLVVASRAAGIEAPIDSVYIDFKDEVGLRKSARIGKQIGFQGKLTIHPNQIDIVNEVFAPTLEEITKAKKIVEMYDAATHDERGVIQVDGQMVDAPVVERARKVLSSAGLISS